MKFLCSTSPMNGGLNNEMFKSLLEEAGHPLSDSKRTPLSGSG